MKKINAERAAEMLRSPDVNWWVKDRTTYLMQQQPEEAEKLIDQLNSIFDGDVA